MSWRIVIVTRIPPVLQGFDEAIRELGHKPVAFLTMLDHDNRFGRESWNMDLVMGAGRDLDVLLPARRSSLAPLLQAVRPDLVVCFGFPWKIPADALAVPTLGWINCHPSLLPKHRGPIPIAWAIRAGDDEIGVTWHRMDAELDTGPILAQRTAPLGDLEAPDVFYPRLGPLYVESLVEALERLASGEEGTMQDGGSYESFFTADDEWLDLSRPAEELHRLAWSWRYAAALDGSRGALLELGGVPVRVLTTSLTEVAGATRVECGDAPLWIVATEELSEAEATRSSAPAPSTR
ncbi:MAG TPA: formyltransferase family protein [Gaiellaceae bacterium]|nr:formyltransferase family protein [Gaiellaceae bacterium]